MKIKQIGTLVALSLPLLIGTARAATESFSESYPTLALNQDLALSLPQFDPGLGTLNSVTLMVSENIDSGTIGIYNGATFDDTGTLTFQGSFVLTITGLQARTDIDTITVPVSLAIGQNVFPAIVGSNSGMASSTDPDVLIEVTGTGMIPVRGNAGADLEFSGRPTAGINSANVIASGMRTVTYDYTPAPEPTSIWLIGLGMTSFGLRRYPARSGRHRSPGA